MNKFVLDSSAVLAYLQNETGADKVKKNIKGSFLSAVNFSEIVTKLCDKNILSKHTLYAIEATGIVLFDYTAEQAYITGDLRNSTRHLGLSLGDRACLALAKIKNLPVLTADTAWAQLNGFEIVLIREQEPG